MPLLRPFPKSQEADIRDISRDLSTMMYHWRTRAGQDRKGDIVRVVVWREWQAMPDMLLVHMVRL